MSYFAQCQSVEEAKKHYRALLMQYHPDHAGPEGEAITKEIIAQFNAFLNGFMSYSFHSYYEDKEWKPKDEAVTPFQEVLQKIIDLDCQIEIIGFWIYCFNSKAVKEQLEALDFWFSGKHKAWVYSGRPKRTGREKKNIRLKQRFRFHNPCLCGGNSNMRSLIMTRAKKQTVPETYSEVLYSFRRTGFFRCSLFLKTPRPGTRHQAFLFVLF
jgi:hypothetical protein